MHNSEKIGVVKATSLVAGNMIGSGALLAPALLAPFGSWTLVGWILTTIGALGLALVFSRLSSWLTKSGGPFTFVQHVFGDFAGFHMAWSYWFSAIFGSISLVIGTLQYTSIFLPDVMSNPTLSIGLGCGIIWLFTFINMKGIKTAATVEVLVLIMKVVPLLVIAFAGLFYINYSTIAQFPPIDDLTSLKPMVCVLLWSFLGLESVTVPTQHIKNPKITIPLATIAGVLMTALVYILGAITINSVIPGESLLSSKAPYVDAGMMLFGEYGKLGMIITGIIAIAGSLNGWILIQGQVPLSAAQEGIFPAFFAKTNRQGAPIGVICSSLIMTFVFLSTYQESLLKHVELMIDVAVVATLLPYFYCVIAFGYMIVTKRSSMSRKESYWLWMILFVALVYTLFAICSTSTTVIAAELILLLIGAPVFCYSKRGSVSKI